MECRFRNNRYKQIAKSIPLFVPTEKERADLWSTSVETSPHVSETPTSQTVTVQCRTTFKIYRTAVRIRLRSDTRPCEDHTRNGYRFRRLTKIRIIVTSARDVETMRSARSNVEARTVTLCQSKDGSVQSILRIFPIFKLFRWGCQIPVSVSPKSFGLVVASKVHITTANHILPCLLPFTHRVLLCFDSCVQTLTPTPTHNAYAFTRTHLSIYPSIQRYPCWNPQSS